MLFRKTLKFKIGRSSICLADDVNAPNEETISISSSANLSELMVKITECLPNYDNAMWRVECNNRKLALLVFDNEKKCYDSELLVADDLVKNLKSKKIFCRYFFRGDGYVISEEDGKYYKSFLASSTSGEVKQEITREEIKKNTFE